ncbi:MAG: hypothetical protein RBT04_06870, partial [Sphaerochaetaceae bacterium]|nr:hypothetical protein [Sphaerochaetaceae bacterium]
IKLFSHLELIIPSNRSLTTTRLHGMMLSESSVCIDWFLTSSEFHPLTSCTALCGETDRSTGNGIAGMRAHAPL